MDASVVARGASSKAISQVWFAENHVLDFDTIYAEFILDFQFYVRLQKS